MITEIKKQIIDDLDKLPIEMQKRVKDFVQALVISKPKGTPGKDLLKFAGILNDEDAKEIREAIEEGCGKVDKNGW